MGISQVSLGPAGVARERPLARVLVVIRSRVKWWWNAVFVYGSSHRQGALLSSQPFGSLLAAQVAPCRNVARWRRPSPQAWDRVQRRQLAARQVAACSYRRTKQQRIDPREKIGFDQA